MDEKHRSIFAIFLHLCIQGAPLTHSGMIVREPFMLPVSIKWQLLAWKCQQHGGVMGYTSSLCTSNPQSMKYWTGSLGDYQYKSQSCEESFFQINCFIFFNRTFLSKMTNGQTSQKIIYVWKMRQYFQLLWLDFDFAAL